MINSILSLDILLVLFALSWTLPILKNRQMFFLRLFRYSILIYIVLLLTSHKTVALGYILGNFSPILFFHSPIIALVFLVIIAIIQHIYSLKTFSFIRLGLNLLNKLNSEKKNSNKKEKSIEGLKDVFLYIKLFSKQINLETKIYYFSIAIGIIILAYTSKNFTGNATINTDKFLLLKKRLPAFALLVFFSQIPSILLFKKINKKLQNLLQK